jgi:hypothetical protein
VKEVLEQLKAVAKGGIKTPDTAKRKFGNIVFAAVTVPQADILGLLRKVRTVTRSLGSDVNFFCIAQIYLVHVCWSLSLY